MKTEPSSEALTPDEQPVAAPKKKPTAKKKPVKKKAAPKKAKAKGSIHDENVELPRSVDEAKEKGKEILSEAGAELMNEFQEPAKDMISHYFGLFKAIGKGALDGATKAKNERQSETKK